MEVLLILALASVVLIAPIVAIILGVGANKKIRDLQWRLTQAEQEIDRLKTADRVASRTPPASQPRETHAAPAHAPQPPPAPKAAPPLTPAAAATPPPLPLAASQAPARSEPPPAPTTPPPRFISEPTLTPPPPPLATPSKKANLEQFMGVKLAAWLGGITLTLALVFLIKYAFEHSWIPAPVRVGLGFVAGLALVVGGIQMTQRNYAVTGQTLSATGFVTLYAITFAAHAIWTLPAFSTIVSLVIMVLVTAGAFILASAQRAHVIAILGLVAGFLTPVLLSTGEDNPVGLFTYIAVLDIGLFAIAARRDWTYLTLLGALGTLAMQCGWFLKFYEPVKLTTLVVICTSFVVLFGVAHAWMVRKTTRNEFVLGSALIAAAVALFLSIPLASDDLTAVRPAWVLGQLFVGDAGALIALLVSVRYSRLHPLSGLLAFGVLTIWLSDGQAAATPGWAVAAILTFAALHSAAPEIRRRLNHEESELPLAGVFPLIGLLVMLPVVFGGETTTTWVWPGSIVLVVLALVRALATRSLLPLGLVLVGSVIVLGAAVLRIPLDADTPLIELAMVVLMAVGFVFAALAVSRRSKATTGEKLPPTWAEHMPEVSATVPFVLLTLVATRIRPDSVTLIFLTALALVVLLLWLALRRNHGGSCVGAVVGVLMVEHAMHFGRILEVAPGERLVWHIGFALLPLLYLLVFRKKTLPLQGAVAAAALSVPGHLFLIVNTSGLALPALEPGLVAVLLALPVLGVLLFAKSAIPPDSSWRLNRLAWLGASALCCLTAAIPLQYSNQWLTLGWALEGAALIALFRKLPHPGLRAAGTVLLCVVFVRLVANEQVLHYGVRGAWPIWNWILASYGTATVSCFAGAWLMSPPDARVLGAKARPLLVAFGAILAFLLVNLQIADYFTPWGRPLELSFSGNFARDMAYTIAWAVFALVVLIAGIRTKSRAARYAALGLLGAATLKIFLHDLSRLDQLYKIGALVAVAFVAIVCSWLYQRFLRTSEDKQD